MSLALNRSSVIQHLKHGDVIEIVSSISTQDCHIHVFTMTGVGIGAAAMAAV